MLRTIALAAVAATLVTAPASAAEYHISTANLHTAEGAAKFDAKVRRAASRLCHAHIGIARTTCVKDVRDEALAKLPAPKRLAYSQSRNQAPIENAALAMANGG